MNGMITQLDEAFKYLKEVMGVELYGWDAARFAVKDSLEACEREGETII